MATVKKFLTDTVIYGFTTIVSRMLGFLMTPIYLRKFKDAAIYGVFTDFYAWASMLNAILAFGMETTYFRYLGKVEEHDKPKVYNNSFVVTLCCSVLLLLFVFTSTEAIARWFAQSGDVGLYTSYVKLFAFILVADALAVVPFARLRAQGRPIRYSYLKFVNIFVTITANLFFFVFLPDWIKVSTFWADLAKDWFVEGWLGYVFISNLLASSVTLLLLLPEIFALQLRVDRPLLRSMLIYSFPIMVANISFIINENLDKMFFRRLLPGDQAAIELGIYGAVAKLAIFLQLFVTAFRLGAEPFFFAYAKNENAPRTYAKIMEYFVLLMVVVMVALTANLSWLKNFIQGNELQPDVYWSGLKIVPILLFNYVLLGIYMNLSVWYKLTDQTRYGLYISGIGALVTIVLNIVFIPLYSYVGAVLSTTVVYAVMACLSQFWGQKHYPIPYPWQKIITYLVLGLLLSFVSFFAFDSDFWIGNLLLLMFMGGIAYFERDNIRGFWIKSKSG